MSLFGDYIKERLNKSIVENENGFATYYYVSDVCYIEDIYIVPHMRKSKEASKLADMIAKEAKNHGFKWLYGSVSMKALNPTTSVKVLLAYGFELARVEDDAIYFKKSLGEI